MINPIITKSSKETEESDEGCLSLPDKGGIVLRNKQVNVTFINDKGVMQKMSFS